jgi:acyl-CoA synthetase (AMP-forming)/AMP-acid ligase II
MAAKLRELVTGVMGLEPEGPAIEFEGRWTTWSQLAGGMRQLDRLLGSGDLRDGARVGVLLRNRPQFAACILEVVTSNRCLVTLNPVYPDDRVAADIEKSAAPVVVGAAQDWARPALRAAVERTGAMAIAAAIEPDGSISFQLLAAGQPLARSHAFAPGVSVEMLTSGTTGAPKRIPLAAATFERSMLDFATFEKGREDLEPRLRRGVQILMTPFAHIGGVGGLINIVTSGRSACLLERFTVPAFHDALVRHRPRVVGGPPTVLRMLLNAGIPKADMASVVVFRSGTAPLDPALAAEFEARYGIPVLQNYGATEFAGGVAGWTNDDHKLFGKSKTGSVGRLNAGVQGRIVDPATGAGQGPGEPGVLELKAKHLGDGLSWIRTTDLAVLDEDGFLFIRGRADNAIIRGGYKISPDDVVRALEAHPSVAEASVVGLADERLGQAPVAAMVPEVGASPVADEEIGAFLRRTLSPYQIPVAYRWVAELPRTQSLKVDQTEVRKLFASAAEAPA